MSICICLWLVYGSVHAVINVVRLQCIYIAGCILLVKAPYLVHGLIRQKLQPAISVVAYNIRL